MIKVWVVICENVREPFGVFSSHKKALKFIKRITKGSFYLKESDLSVHDVSIDCG
jgi:hypothetical protein